MRSSRSCNRGIVYIFVLAFSSGATWISCAQQSVSRDPHVIRVWGYKGLSPLLLRWEAAYEKTHPGIRFDNQLHAPAAVMAGLYNGVADVALMGREIWPVDTMAYRWVFQQQPFGVMVATDGLNGPGTSFTPVVIVNAKNPLTAISLSQLDAIFGSEHRAAPANIRTWGDLGLGGDWAARPIHAYGFGAEDALGVFFRHDVLKSDFKPNPESHLLSDHDGNKVDAARRIEQAVATDTYAIGYTRSSHDSETKTLALAAPEPVAATEASLAEHRYPLVRSISIYFHRVPDQAIDPNVDAFVRFILSSEAQAMIHSSDGFLALTPALAGKQIQKLNSPMPKLVDAEEKE